MTEDEKKHVCWMQSAGCGMSNLARENFRALCVDGPKSEWLGRAIRWQNVSASYYAEARRFMGVEGSTDA